MWICLIFISLTSFSSIGPFILTSTLWVSDETALSLTGRWESPTACGCVWSHCGGCLGMSNSPPPQVWADGFSSTWRVVRMFTASWRNQCGVGGGSCYGHSKHWNEEIFFSKFSVILAWTADTIYIKSNYVFDGAHHWNASIQQNEFQPKHRPRYNNKSCENGLWIHCLMYIHHLFSERGAHQKASITDRGWTWYPSKECHNNIRITFWADVDNDELPRPGLWLSHCHRPALWVLFYCSMTRNFSQRQFSFSDWMTGVRIQLETEQQHSRYTTAVLNPIATALFWELITAPLYHKQSITDCYSINLQWCFDVRLSLTLL